MFRNLPTNLSIEEKQFMPCVQDGVYQIPGILPGVTAYLEDSSYL